jgi:pimeloyl-ACP methyl ester carboxylesterase
MLAIGLAAVASMTTSAFGTANDPFAGKGSFEVPRTRIVDKMKTEAAAPNKYSINFEGPLAETAVADGGMDQSRLPRTDPNEAIQWDIPNAFLMALMGSSATPTAPGDAMFTRPGKIFRASDGAELNFYCTGAGSPTVILDGAFDWAPVWSLVQPRVSAFTRVCSYDRIGLGFSGPPPGPLTIDRIANELHSALTTGGITGPYILVGAGWGGNHIRAFADLFPRDVAGLILVDAEASDVDTPENRAVDDNRVLSFLPRIRACRAAIAAGNPEPAIAAAPDRPPRPCRAGFFRGFPEEAWSAELNASIRDTGGRNVATWDSNLSEAENMPMTETWLQQHRRNLGQTPIRILTSGHHAVHHRDKPPPMSLEELKFEYDRAIAQSRWTSLSSNAKQLFVTNSSAYIMFDQPDAIAQAVKDILGTPKR